MPMAKNSREPFAMTRDPFVMTASFGHGHGNECHSSIPSKEDIDQGLGDRKRKISEERLTISIQTFDYNGGSFIGEKAIGHPTIQGLSRQPIDSCFIGDDPPVSMEAIALRGTKGVPRKGVWTSVNLRVWTCEESRAKHDQTSCYSRPPFLGTPLVPSRRVVVLSASAVFRFAILALLGWHYLSNATCLIRPRFSLVFVCYCLN